MIDSFFLGGRRQHSWKWGAYQYPRPREEYGKPTIDSYGDLQDLLLLDPIHEIAPEAGWPKRREEA